MKLSRIRDGRSRGDPGSAGFQFSLSSQGRLAGYACRQDVGTTLMASSGDRVSGAVEKAVAEAAGTVVDFGHFGDLEEFFVQFA